MRNARRRECDRFHFDLSKMAEVKMETVVKSQFDIVAWRFPNFSGMKTSTPL